MCRDNANKAARTASATVYPPWTELPSELTALILERLGTKEIIQTADKVCATWRRVCKTPNFWRVINIRNFDPIRVSECYYICEQAVRRSDGELIDLTMENFANDELMFYVAERSSNLRRLTIACDDAFNGIPAFGLATACTGFSLLEELHILSPFFIQSHHLADIGGSFPMLKSFTLNQGLSDGNVDALAIANIMRNLCHLRLFGNSLDNNGLRAILDGCPSLNSLDLRRCRAIFLGGPLGVRVRQQIEDLRLPSDSLDDYDYDVWDEYDGITDSDDDDDDDDEALM